MRAYAERDPERTPSNGRSRMKRHYAAPPCHCPCARGAERHNMTQDVRFHSLYSFGWAVIGRLLRKRCDCARSESHALGVPGFLAGWAGLFRPFYRGVARGAWCIILAHSSRHGGDQAASGMADVRAWGAGRTCAGEVTSTWGGGLVAVADSAAGTAPQAWAEYRRGWADAGED